MSRLIKYNGYYIVMYHGKGIGEFVPLEDGYYYWFPNKNRQGAIGAEMLQYVVDELNKINKEWDDIVQNDPLINGENE